MQFLACKSLAEKPDSKASIQLERNRSPQTPPKYAHVSVERYESFHALARLRSEWDQLAIRSGADLFASFDWCSIWWHHFGRGRIPEFYIARAEGRLIGCLPFFRERVGYGPWAIDVVRLVGSCDAGTRCDLAVEPAYLVPVLEAVMERIQATGPWDVIHIGDFPGEYQQGRLLARTLHEQLPESQVNFRSGYYPNSVFDVPSSYEDYLKNLSANERSGIRRTERRLHEQHSSRILTTQPENFDPDFRKFVRQHQKWWKRCGRLGYFADWPGSTEFHREFGMTQARAGRLQLLRLDADGEPIAYLYCHRFGSRIHWFSGSRAADPRWDAFSPGRQLHCALMRQAIDLGVSMIDGMCGHYDYKLRWGARTTLLQNITAINGGFLSRMSVRDVATVMKCDFAFKRVWFWHLAPWLRRAFPAVRASWLRRGQSRNFVRSRFLNYAMDTSAADAVLFDGRNRKA